MHEHRDEVGYSRVPQQVVADPGELTVNELGIERAEFAGHLGLGLPHPLLEFFVALSHGTWILTQSGRARQALGPTRSRVRRVGELAELGCQQIGDLLADVHGVIADPLERT